MEPAVTIDLTPLFAAAIAVVGTLAGSWLILKANDKRERRREQREHRKVIREKKEVAHEAVMLIVFSVWEAYESNKEDQQVSAEAQEEMKAIQTKYYPWVDNDLRKMLTEFYGTCSSGIKNDIMSKANAITDICEKRIRALYDEELVAIDPPRRRIFKKKKKPENP